MSKRNRTRGGRSENASVQPLPSAQRWPDVAIATGLALVVFFRPWRDGASFQGFNAYFVWLTMAMAALWSARVFFKESVFQYHRIAVPLALFILTAVLTSYDAYLPDFAYRGITYWVTGFFLFVLAANTLRDPTVRAVFFGAFAVTMTLSAAWALIHLEFVLPQVRTAVEQNPGTRQYFFQTSDLPADLAHRLSVNRAYGATLFPNALAAFMILTLPMLGSEFLLAVREWRQKKVDSTVTPTGWAFSCGVPLATTILLTLSSRFAFPIVYVSVTGNRDWHESGLLAPLVIYVLPTILGLSLGVLLRFAGKRTVWLLLRLWFVPVAFCLVALALYKTYSRGGMLALFLAAIVVFVLWLARTKVQGRLRPTTTALILGTLVVTAASVQAQNVSIPDEGVNPDVLSAGSVLARLDYWRVGLSMIADNPWTGVGLGGFGPAYARYMFPGASISQMAHNHFIQVFAEVGVFGFLCIVAFWTLVLRVGVQAVLFAKEGVVALSVAGPFCGVLAFLLHSCVDFNFANPSLLMTALVFTGAMLARAADVCPPKTLSAEHGRIAAVLMLAAAALTTAGMIRIYSVDYALTGPMPVTRKLMLAGNRLEIRDKLFAARFYLEKLSTHEENPERLLYSGYAELTRIIPDHYRMLEFGYLARLDTSSGFRFEPLADAPSLPDDAVIVITDVPKAKQALFASARALLDDLERIDRPYPYILEASLHAFQWCDLAFSHADDPETRRRFVLLAESWAWRSVERAPHQSGAWRAYAKSLWQRATTETDSRSIRKYYDEGIIAYRRAAESFPVSTDGWNNLAIALENLGRSYVEGGDRVAGEALLAEASQVREHIKTLREQWAAATRQGQ